ncbi:MAG: DinB family protein [Pyrinomonadaceae bacterium]
MNRPEKEEYAGYYETYVSLVAEIDIVSALENQISELQNLFAAIPEQKSSYAYAEGKWSIKQLIGHLIDGERVFSYRALRISRNDKTPLAGFEEKSYIANSNFSNAELADLTKEFSLLRGSNVLFFKNLNDEAWLRTGTASDAEVSVRALAYIMVGHVRHHANILRERYLA